MATSQTARVKRSRVERLIESFHRCVNWLEKEADAYEDKARLYREQAAWTRERLKEIEDV